MNLLPRRSLVRQAEGPPRCDWCEVTISPPFIHVEEVGLEGLPPPGYHGTFLCSHAHLMKWTVHVIRECEAGRVLPRDGDRR